MMVNHGTNGQAVMTAKEVCSYLRIPLSTLYSLTKRGKIKGAKIGKHWRYLDDDVYTYLVDPQANTNGQPSINGHPHFVNGRPDSVIIQDPKNQLNQLGVGDPVRIVFKIPENGKVVSFEMEGRIVQKELQAPNRKKEQGDQDDR